MSHLNASEIRELLKLTARPEVISFAGGLPAPELFPIEAIKKAADVTLTTYGAKALQYTTTEGFDPLRDWIAARANQQNGTNYDRDNVLIVHGSQQALDFAGKVFLNKGDVVLCETPTYLAAITAFKAYECQFIEVPTDDHGMILEDLEKILQETQNVKIIYAIPSFQNPTGKTWTTERRKGLAALSKKFNIPVLEDDPYGEIRFEGESQKTIASYDEAGNVLLLGTFSKIFCPGYRIGWVIGDKELVSKFALVKQGADLQCNTLAQMEIYTFLQMNDIDEHIKKIVDVYRVRRNLLLDTIDAYFPEGIKHTNPEGGLFAWVELPEHIDTRALFEKCLENNVAFVPGDSFFPNGGNKRCLRLNFSNMPDDRIVEGIKRMALALKEFM